MLIHITEKCVSFEIVNEDPNCIFWGAGNVSLWLLIVYFGAGKVKQCKV